MATSSAAKDKSVWLSVRTLPGGALVVWPETLSRTPWLINKLAGGPPFFVAVSSDAAACSDAGAAAGADDADCTSAAAGAGHGLLTEKITSDLNTNFHFFPTKGKFPPESPRPHLFM